MTQANTQDWLNIEHKWALDQAEEGSPFNAAMTQIRGGVAVPTTVLYEGKVQYITCPLCKRWFHPNQPHECHKDGVYVKF